MSRSLNVRRSVALTAALVVTTWGTVALPAVADEGDQADNGTSGQTQESGGLKDKSDEKSKDEARDKGQGKRKGGKDQPGTHGNGGGSENVGGDGDPAGNNGTVKIAPLGEMDSIPNNTPHPGCTFQIEWYGYDEGADIVSTVSFAMQAPTKDVGLAVDGPSSVFVGGDPASGAGTDTGLDGREAYTLSFNGEPHPKQGYHVKLTVATPRSNGNDTKTKVFWVEPCGAETGADTGTPSTETEHRDRDRQRHGLRRVRHRRGGGAGHGRHRGPRHPGLDRPEQRPEVSPARAQDGNASVPTVVDAGENGHSAFGDFVRSPWPLLLVGLGALLTFAGFVSRRRHGADGQE